MVLCIQPSLRIVPRVTICSRAGSGHYDSGGVMHIVHLKSCIFHAVGHTEGGPELSHSTLRRRAECYVSLSICTSAVETNQNISGSKLLSSLGRGRVFSGAQPVRPKSCRDVSSSNGSGSHNS